MAYESDSACILRTVTDRMPVVWSPERGWHDAPDDDTST